MSGEELERACAYYKRQLDALSGEHVRFTYLVAQQHHSLRQQQQALTLLSVLHDALGGATDPDRVFGIAVENIGATMRMDRVAVLVPAGTEGWRPSHWAGYPVAAAASLGDARVAPLDPRPMLVDERAEVTPEIAALRRVAPPYFVLLPVQVEDEVVALLVAGRLGAHLLNRAVDVGDVAALRSVAGLIAAWLRNLRMAALAEERRLALRLQREELLMELHDGVNASLARAALHLEADARDAAMDSLREGMSEARLAMTLIEGSPAPLEEVEAELRRDLRAACEPAGLALEFLVRDGGGSGWLAPVERHTLRRIAREATTNVLKHAVARTLRCTLEASPGSVLLRVEDDGKGIGGGAGAGRGLGILRRRATRLGGTLDVGTRPEGGTFVEARLPLSMGT